MVVPTYFLLVVSIFQDVLCGRLAYFDFSLTGVGLYRIRPNVGEHEMIDASIQA